MTNRADYAARARSLREHGSNVRYYHDEVGYNYRMEGIQGAVLGVKLRHLPAWNAARRRPRPALSRAARAHAPPPAARNARRRERLSSLCRAPPRPATGCANISTARGIGTALHYPLPLHLQKCFADLGHKPGDFPVAERAARECLSLPIFPELSDEQQAFVAAAINEFTGW